VGALIQINPRDLPLGGPMLTCALLTETA